MNNGKKPRTINACFISKLNDEYSKILKSQILME